MLLKCSLNQKILYNNINLQYYNAHLNYFKNKINVHGTL